MCCAVFASIAVTPRWLRCGRMVEMHMYRRQPRASSFGREAAPITFTSVSFTFVLRLRATAPLVGCVQRLSWPTRRSYCCNRARSTPRCNNEHPNSHRCAADTVGAVVVLPGPASESTLRSTCREAHRQIAPSRPIGASAVHRVCRHPCPIPCSNVERTHRHPRVCWSCWQCRMTVSRARRPVNLF